jgi:hypothetical protein
MASIGMQLWLVSVLNASFCESWHLPVFLVVNATVHIAGSSC